MILTCFTVLRHPTPPHVYENFPLALHHFQSDTFAKYERSCLERSGNVTNEAMSEDAPVFQSESDSESSHSPLAANGKGKGRAEPTPNRTKGKAKAMIPDNASDSEDRMSSPAPTLTFTPIPRRSTLRLQQLKRPQPSSPGPYTQSTPKPKCRKITGMLTIHLLIAHFTKGLAPMILAKPIVISDSSDDNAEIEMDARSSAPATPLQPQPQPEPQPKPQPEPQLEAEPQPQPDAAEDTIWNLPPSDPMTPPRGFASWDDYLNDRVKKALTSPSQLKRNIWS